MWHFYGKLVNRLPLCFRPLNRIFLSNGKHPWPKSETSDISKHSPSPLHHTFLLGRARFTAQPLSALLHTIPSQEPLTNSIVPSQICKRLLKTGWTEAYTFRFIDQALKKGWHFFLCRIYLSSSYPKSHDESWSLQGRLQRPLTKRGSNSSRSTLVTLSLTFCHSVSYSSWSDPIQVLLMPSFNN